MSKKIIDNFSIKGDFVSATPYGNGHINGTELVVTREGDREHKYILQRINKNVFKRPDLLMENYVSVTEFIRGKILAAGGDPEREVINVIKTHDGESYCIDENGEYWRMLVYVTDNISYDRVEKPEQFYESAVAFGNFQYMLRDYPADTLHETIVNFHNTPDRYRQLMEAVERDVCGRLAEVTADVEFAKARRDFAATFERAREEGRLPLRVTHNDTKLNNILMDAKTGKAKAVIDLDTIMPGSMLYDFGDSFRFGASTAAEDEKDLSKVHFDIELFKAYAEGYCGAVKNSITKREAELLPYGAYLMTIECGMRFLADYLSCDTYFATKYEGHNLVRCRTQFALAKEMEEQMSQMNAIIENILK